MPNTHTTTLGTDEVAFYLETGEVNAALDSALENAAIEAERTKLPVVLTITINFVEQTVRDGEIVNDAPDEEEGEELPAPRSATPTGNSLFDRLRKEEE